MPEPQGKELPDYRKPPVAEVVYGVRYSTAVPFQTRHLGQFWLELGNSYPHTTDAFPLMEISEIGPKMVPIPIPLRRIIASSADRQYLLQIQDTRLYSGWRQTDPPVAYPRFPAVESRFESAWSRLADFAAAQGLGKIAETHFELTYVNQIPADRGIPQAAEKYLKTVRFSDLDGPQFAAPRGLNQAWKFALPDAAGEGTITAADADANGKKALQLTLACSGPAGSQERRKWFSAAHEWIVKGFTELTTHEGHAEWGIEQ